MSVPTPHSYRCATCQSTSVDPRNLVVFIDGTSNKPGDKNTNVFKLFTDIAPSTANGAEIEQPKRYLMGIGAHNIDHVPSSLSRVRMTIAGCVEMAFAGNVGENIKKAYDWLVDTYREGDRIYLFGFSRGAYQVRALASMIHEVGLVKAKGDCETAYGHYLSIDFYKPQGRPLITQFKTEFCWPGVRVHFIGVWDTVSSLGLIKKDVHVTASASVTNACHFRHALGLDELRVKFLPEYFGEMNAHHSNIRSPRLAVSDVEEVWFAGSHPDVGGINCKQNPMVAHCGGNYSGFCIGHAGNVTFGWMRKEAAANGLVFKSNESAWDPQDVDLGTKESMTFWWKILEAFPIRHQVSFSGTGEHKWRWHLCRPRSVIPSQRFHPSIFSADIYTPHATLGNSARNPVALQRSLDTTASLDERTKTGFLESLLKDQRTTLDSLEKVLFLIDSTLDNGQTQTQVRPQWNLSDFQDPPFAKYVLTVIYDVTSNVGVSEELLNGARNSLCDILRSPPDPLEFTRTLYVLRFSAKHPRLRMRFIDDDVTGALMVALERTAKSPSEILFPLVTDCLCYLIADENLSRGVINRFHATPDGTGITQTRISLTLDVKEPVHLMASLKMVARLAQHRPDLCKEFKPKLYELAKKERDGVGSAAVKALVAMNAQLTSDIYICNTLGYLGSILPPLDVEAVSSPSPDNTDELPTVLQANGTLEGFMRELVSTIESRNVYERTATTLTLLKLCRNSVARDFCTRHNVLNILVRQLEQKKTSLLAAYALRKCLEYNLWTSDCDSHVAPALVSMVEKNWFDDAIGRVEGCEIFRGLMTSVNLRKRVIELKIVLALINMLAGGERHQTRMGLIYIDILDEESPLDLKDHVEESIAYLRDKDRKVRMKGVKVISALAHTVAGERAIKERLGKIIDILLEKSPDGRTLSRSQIVGAPAVLYNLAKNETLREHIQESPDFARWKAHRCNTLTRPQRQATLRT